MSVVRRLTEGDALQMVEDTVLQRLTLSVRRDVVAYLADLLDGSRPDRGAGVLAFNSLIDYPAGTVGARIKTIITGIGSGQPWGDVEALLADLAGLIGGDVLTPELRDAIALVTADATVPGSVAARLAAESLARSNALIDEAEARNLAIAEAINDSTAIDDAINLEVIARNDAIEVETQARIKAIEDEEFARGEAIGVEADSRNTLATQLRGGYTGTNLDAITSGLLFDERQARSTADASEVSTRQALSAKLTGNVDPASLTLGTLSSGLLYDEREARATAVSGEASSRTSLATQLRGAYTGSDLALISSGLLYDERQARSTADASEVSARQSLSAKLTGNVDPASLTLGTLSSGLLYEEREARATAVSGEASSRTSLATQLRGAYTGTDLALISSGLLYDERQARSTADASEVSARQSLSAKLTGNVDPASLTLDTLSSGLLYEEREARATAVSGEASSRTSLATQLRGAYTGTDLALISSGLLYDERQARSTADASEVSARQSLSAKLTGNVDPASLTLGTLSSGLLYDEREARATAVAAEAYSRSLLAVAVGELSGDVAEEIGIRADQVSGIHANYSMKVVATRADGKKVFGLLGLNATLPTDGAGGESQILLSADSLLFVPASNINAMPAAAFELGLVDGVTTLRVPAARIGDLSISSLKIGDNAVTVASAGQAISASPSTTDAVMLDLGTMNTTVNGVAKPLYLHVEFDGEVLAASTGGGLTRVLYNVNINGVSVRSYEFAATVPSQVRAHVKSGPIWVATPPTGNFTVTVTGQLLGNTGGGAEAFTTITLFALGTKK